MSSSRDILDPDVFTPDSGVKEIDRSGVLISDPNLSTISFREDAARGSNPMQYVSRYLDVLFQYKWLIFRTMLICMVLGWVALLVWPRTFESESKLIIRVGRESVSLDPTATTSQTLMLQKTQEEEVNSALEVLSSRQVAESVVSTLGADNVIEGVLPAEGGAPPSGFKVALQKAKRAASDMAFYAMLYAGLKDDISSRELAVRKVQSTVDIFAPKRSNVVTIHAESKTPEMAQAIAAQITQGFLDQHLAVSKTDGSRNFFAVQSEQVQSRLNSLMQQRSEYMQERKIVSIDANRGLLKDQLTAIDRDIILARGGLEQALAECEDITTKLGDTEDEIVASKLEGSNQTWSGMRQRVYELELQERKFASMYKDDHQLLVQTREQLEGAREILEAMQSDRVDASRTPNPVKRRMEEDLQKQQTKVVGLRSILSEKQKQRSETEEEVNKLLVYEQELTEKDREIGLVENSLQTLREKLEEARVIEELQSERISNVSVFQPATFVERAVNPKKRILAAAFVMLGLMGGVGLAFLKNAVSPNVRSAGDIQSRLACPVLAEIPALPQGEISHQKSRNEQLVEPARNILSEVLLGNHTVQSSRGGHCIGVIGVEAGAGATTLAIQLAQAASEEGALRTVLVDADTKRRGLSRALGLNGSPGLVELVRGEASHDECLQNNGRSKVALIASSSMNSNSRLTAVGRDVAAALHVYRQASDLMVIDLPPADHPDHAMGLAQYLDGVIVVIESEKTRIKNADRLLSRLGASNANVIGMVINKHKKYMPGWLEAWVDPTA